MSAPSIFLGVTTYNRPNYLHKSLRAIGQHVADLCDTIAIHNDGSDPKYNAEYSRAYRRLNGAIIQDSSINEGVACSKNHLLRCALESTDAKWIVLAEDDILALNQDAILGYIRACEDANVHHLSFAHHGPANTGFPDGDGPISFFPHSIGAWCIFTRECLESVGLFDENFNCAWEHVEHEVRLIQAGYMPDAGPHNFPDATGSVQWVAEIPDSINHSSIRPRPDWFANIKAGLEYWQREKSDTFQLLFGEGLPLHDYAMGILGQ